MELPPVYVHIVTFNNETTIRACIEAVFAQRGFSLNRNLRLCVTDNASQDRTVEIVAAKFSDRLELITNRINNGFTGAHNEGAARMIASGSKYLLLLNPDLRLEPDALSVMVSALELDRRAGWACPKLYRADNALQPVEPKTFDSTGMFITPEIRHFDRGSGEADTGQFERPQYVFGASGAAALLRSNFIQDVALESDVVPGSIELFDRCFFAYREDADLAWRAQQLGWSCRYVPQAIGYHQRQVLPEKRAALAPELNAYSVKNRVLLQFNNFSLGANWRCLPYMCWRNLLVLGGVILREKSSIPALRTAWALLSRAKRIRQRLRSRRKAAYRDIAKWFSFRPYAESALEIAEKPTNLSTLTLIIVNFNSGDRLFKSLMVLAQAPEPISSGIALKICVFDNASADQSAKLSRELITDAEQFEWVFSPENLGFAGAINRAAELFPADAYLILNPDAAPEAGAIFSLLSILENFPQLAAVAPLLKGNDGELQRGYSLRGLPTIGSTLAELFLLHKLWPGNPWTEALHLSSQPLEQVPGGLPLIIDQPAAACLLVRGKDFAALRGFDTEFYPAWFEDVDFSKRLKKANRLCAVDCSVSVVHEGGYSLKSIGSENFNRIWYTNMLKYWKKHGSLGYFLVRLCLPAALLLRSCAYLVASAFGSPESRQVRRASAKAFLALAGAFVLNRPPLSRAI